MFRKRLFEHCAALASRLWRACVRRPAAANDAGFTLIEALVALALVALCLGAIGALTSRTIRSVVKVDQRLELVSSLRKVEAALPERKNLGVAASGDALAGLWSIEVAPYPDPSPPSLKKEPPQWTAAAILVSVAAPDGARAAVATIRLVKAQP